MAVSQARRSQARKNVVVLFTDLVDFTPMGERLDPEALDRVLDLYFRAAAETVASHGGIIEKFIGDAVMAVFGLPVKHEDDAVRAVHAALRLHSDIARLNAGSLAEYGVELTLRTGIGAGEVAVSTGLDGSPRIVGDAVNTSARLQQAAGPGEIVLGNTAAWMVRGAVDLVPRPPTRVKGKSAPLRAWTVYTAAQGPSPTPVTSAGAELIGRETELDRLCQAVRHVGHSRRGELVLVTGEAGVGKSRLLSEAVAATRQARVIMAGCLPWGGGGALTPVRQLARDAFGDGWIDDLPGLLPEATDASRVAELLGRSLGLRPGTTGAQETAWSLRRLFEEMAVGGQTLVVLCDDFHHAERPLLDLIQDVMAGIAAPVLFIAAARSEFLSSRPSWLADTGSEHIALSPLDDAQSRVLVGALMAASAPTARHVEGHELAGPGLDVVERIVLAAEGNPLFAEQLVAAVLDDPGVRVPPTVQALLEARLDRLSEDERSLLQRAAVVGRNFTIDQVSALAAYEPAVPLEPTISALVHGSMLASSAGTAGSAEAGETGDAAETVTLGFVPGLLHDTAYGTAPKSDRSHWHEAFGRWLIGNGATAPDVVGHHLETAYLLRSAVGGAASPAVAADAARYLFDAAALADNRGDPHSAAATLRRARRILPPGDGRHRHASLLLCDLSVELEDLPGAREALDSADALIGDDPCWPVLKRLQLAILDLQTDPARLAETKALASRPLSGAARRDPEAWFRFHLLNAHVNVIEMRFGAASAALLAALKYAGSRERDVDNILTGLAELALWGPEPVTEGIARCTVLAKRLHGDRARLAPVQGVHAGLAALTGDFAAGRRLGATARSSAEELRLQHVAVALGQMTGLVEAVAGAHRAAEGEYRRSADAFRAGGQLAHAAALDVLAARQLFDQGRPDAAAALDACADLIADADVSGLVAAWSLRALLDAAVGRHDSARSLAARAVALAGTSDDLRGQGNALLDQARVLAVAGHRRDAGRAAGRAAECYGQKGATVLASRARGVEESVR
jgi:class 3 adenylate cyclase/tetratricopeptide (TPR) repeat protein